MEANGDDNIRSASSCPVSSPSTMLSMENALRIVLSIAQRLQTVTLPLHDTLGKVLAEDIRAPDPLPPYRASVKDGYAVVASDGPGEYPIITESRAGNDGIGVTVTSGNVAYVTTGGPIPNGANAVVQVEDTELVEGALGESKRVKILVQARQGLDIRPVEWSKGSFRSKFIIRKIGRSKGGCNSCSSR
uniref:Molybdopterin biosynthesis protein CNX1 n=1 Tax=Nelumbo nucifera TaxID=4432 RepID=A0A822XFD3_NELNU|nr:TPA_asm: hypothetical protein HUJ06_019254 [Nelumbo nucifera]